MPKPLPPTSGPLSATKISLLAAHLASTCELTQLRSLILQHPSTLNDEKLLRILLCLPESSATESYKEFIDYVLSESPLSSTDGEAAKIDSKVVANLPEPDARRALRRLLPKLGTGSGTTTKELLVASFLATRACRIEAELGAFDLVSNLLSPYDQLVKVHDFHTANVNVLSKLVYEYSRQPAPSLGDFYKMGVEEALEVMIADPTTVVRDLTELVEPYLSIREPREWMHVWARLSALPFPYIAEVAQTWTPPDSIRLEFAAWAISACYRCSETHQKTWSAMQQIHRRISGFLDGHADEGEMPEKLGDVTDLQNPLVQPTKAGLRLLTLGATSGAILTRTLAEVVRLRLEGSKEVQTAVLRQLVRSGIDWEKRTDDEWKKLRDGAGWLRTKSEVIGRVAREEMEKILLAGMLAGTRFNLAKSIYVTGDGGVPMEEVEKCVLDAFSEFFDNASNGNRTRGSMKNAHQCIQILYPQTSRSQALERAYRLICAVHALSSYSLTLTPGVPLLPVQIRIHPDPISLFPKLLDSNRRSYLQPDALVSIAQDLVTATHRDGEEINPSDIEARVLGMATEASLNDDDFETAYAYITTRLLPMATISSKGKTAPVVRRIDPTAATSSTPQQPSIPRDVLWRTSLLAGRFRSTLSALSSAPPRGTTALKSLEKKQELLALAIRFCPVDALSEVLTQWRRCEDEAEAVLEAEQRAEEEHLKLAERAGITQGIAGTERHKEGAGRGMVAGLGAWGGKAKGAEARRGSAMEDGEAPQSLFEVARGAASLLGGEGRKREAVKGAVTKGLASGLGWVLGAQPVNQ